MHHTMPDAIRREKRLKKWNRAWKIRLMESMNPEWAESVRRVLGGDQRRPC
jgi:putative endonuclease